MRGGAGAKLGKVPCKFPCYREMHAENGLRQTASPARQSLVFASLAELRRKLAKMSANCWFTAQMFRRENSNSRLCWMELEALSLAHLLREQGVVGSNQIAPTISTQTDSIGCAGFCQGTCLLPLPHCR